MQGNVFTEYAGLWALLGTLFSGVILAVVNKWLSHNKEESDIASDLRSELREENISLKDEVRKLTSEVRALHEQILLLRDEIDQVRSINRKLEDELLEVKQLEEE